MDYASALPYRPERPGRDYWQAPALTMLRGGDCEDKAFLLWHLWALQGIESEVVFGTLCGGGHAWVEWHGVICDPTLGLSIRRDDPIRELYRRIDGSPIILLRVQDYERRTGLRGFNRAYCLMTEAIRRTGRL